MSCILAIFRRGAASTPPAVVARPPPIIPTQRPIPPAQGESSISVAPEAPPLEAGVAYGIPGRGPRPPPGCVARAVNRIVALVEGLFRCCVGSLADSIRSCIFYLIPAESSAPPAEPIILNPEAQTVADFVVAAETGNQSFAFGDAYRRFSPAMHDYVFREIRDVYLGNIPEINDAIERYLREDERKGSPPPRAPLVARAINECIAQNPSHPVIIVILERTLPRGWR